MKETIGIITIILGILGPWMMEPLWVGMLCGTLLVMSGINLIYNG